MVECRVMSAAGVLAVTRWWLAPGDAQARGLRSGAGVVDAARATGCTDSGIVFTQLLPNRLSPLLAPVAFPGPAVLLTALSLNLGATPVRAVE